MVLAVPLAISAFSTEDIYAQTFSLFNQIIALQKQLIRSLDAQIADFASQLSSMKSELAMSKGIGSSVNTQLAAAKIDADSLRSELTTSRNELSSAKALLSSTQSTLSNSQNDLAVCRNRLNASCTFAGLTYANGTTLYFYPYNGYNIRSQSAIPVSAMQVADAAPVSAGSAGASQQSMAAMMVQNPWIPYQCQNGDWVRIYVPTYPYVCPYCPIALKPAIYLYPPTTEKVSVRLGGGFKWTLAASDPSYDSTHGWNVVAHPDGTLENLSDGKTYSYLFWEGKDYPLTADEREGFVVKGNDTREFLRDKLSAIGLTPHEYNEFIVFWLPKMEHNVYNFITFVGKEYAESAPLIITPKPDSILRVFMAFRALDHYKDVTPQTITPFERKGFTVVEWGGMEIPR